MRLVRPSNSASLRRVLADLESTQPTYDTLGAALTRQRPAGFRHQHADIVLGAGRETFERAVEGLQTWKAHRLPGMSVFPHDQAIVVGATVILTLGTSLVSVLVPCRVVAVVDEPGRWGFAYGTLPGHPEQGEEAFTVSISPNETVRFEIEAFSRPGSLLVRLSGAVGRGVQERAAGGYLRALKRFVDEDP
jgi:uncharacterized protein (UPF0548 family)